MDHIRFLALCCLVPVTYHTAEYGSPADHRAALINGELVIVYQSLTFKEKKFSAQQQRIHPAFTCPRVGFFCAPADRPH